MKAKYIRVSTITQNIERQEKTDASKVYVDKVSGMIPFSERSEAKKLLLDISNGLITELEVHSIDRIGRNHYDIATTLKFLEEHNINVIIKNLNISSISNGKKDPMFNMMANILAVLSEQERENLRERQLEGIDIAKRKGVYKGRMNGSTESKSEFIKKYPSVIKDLNKNKYSLREISKLNSISLATVQKIKKYINDGQ